MGNDHSDREEVINECVIIVEIKAREFDDKLGMWET